VSRFQWLPVALVQGVGHELELLVFCGHGVGLASSRAWTVDGSIPHVRLDSVLFGVWDNTSGIAARGEQGMQVRQELERFTEDMLYFDQHRRELLQQYPDRWIAIYNQQVVGAAKDPRRLVRQLERKGIPPGQVFRKYLTEQEDLLIV
jgi:hypothetical protein